MDSPVELVAVGGPPDQFPPERPELSSLVEGARSIEARDMAQVLVELIFDDTGKTVNEDTVAQWATEQVGRLAHAVAGRKSGQRVIEAIALGWVTKGKTRAGQRKTADSVTIFLHVWRRLGPLEQAASGEDWCEMVLKKSTDHLRKQVKGVLGGAWSSSARLAQHVGTMLPSSPSDLRDWVKDAGTVTWSGLDWDTVREHTCATFGNFRTKAEDVETGKLLTSLIGLANPQPQPRTRTPTPTHNPNPNPNPNRTGGGGRVRSFVPDPSIARGMCGLMGRAALRAGGGAGADPPPPSKRARGTGADAGGGGEEEEGRVVEVAGAGAERKVGNAVAGSPQPPSPVAVAVVQVEGGAAPPGGADESLRDQNEALLRQLGEAQAALRQRAESDSVVENRLLTLRHARRALRDTHTHTHARAHTHTHTPWQPRRQPRRCRDRGAA